MTDTAAIPVLIVGAGPVGLALSLDLAYHGVASVLIEQGARTGDEMLGKAGGLNERTMEFCRRWGISGDVSSWGAPADHPSETMYCTSIIGGYSMGCDRSVRPPTALSPAKWTKCPQNVFDPLLARAALATGKVTIRYGTTFERLEQDGEGVAVELTDAVSGQRSRVRARYVVGCDGAGSVVRECLGIGFPGKSLDYSLSIMLNIRDFARYTGHKNVERFMFIGPRGTWANVTSMDWREMWRFVMVGSEQKLDLNTLDVRAELNRAFGRDDVPYEVLCVVPWRRSERIADRYRAGRVFLAGDAAHTTSPTGAHGLNTGLGDVNGLGWMLAGVISGWADPALLGAYEAERRPVAVRNCSSSTQNYRFWVGEVDFSKVLEPGPDADAAREKIGRSLSAGLHHEWNSLGIVLGYRYEGSPIVVPDGSPETPDPVAEYVPTARPGHRAPHAWLPDGRSILDLFGRRFVLLRLGREPADVSDLVHAAQRHGLPLDVIDVHDEKIRALYERRLVLVRPDGHSAWRADAPPKDADRLVQTIRGSKQTLLTA